MTLRDSDRAARLRQAIAAKRRGAQGRPGDIGPRPDDEPARLGEWQRGLWFVHRLEPQSAAYNLCSAFAVEGALDITRLERAVETVVHRHRLLRSSFRPDADGALQILHDRLPITAERIVTAEGLGRAALTRAAAEPFDLEHGPLVRLRVIQEASGTHYLLLALHHILADERSLGFLWREIAVVYERRARQAPSRQPSSTTTTSTGAGSSPTVDSTTTWPTGSAGSTRCPSPCGCRSNARLQRPAGRHRLVA